MGRLNKKWKIIINIVAVVILLAGVLTSLMYSILITGAKNMDSDSKKLVSGSNSDSESVETAVVYNRNTYAYKKGLINILVLGIDGEGNLYDGHTAGNMGQSDAIYLLSIDTINKKISVIGIPRDTMTSVRFFDQDGSLTTANTAQIAVQYAFGSDIDDSLKNLQVDYVDLYWLHHDDEKISVEEIIDTLVALVREGKIRYFGCSNWNTARIREALDYSRKKKIPEFVGNQVMYNLAKYNQERLDQEIMFGMTSEMYALHKKEGLAVMCYSSQAQGYFSCADKEDFMENPVYDNPREFYENEISRLRLKKVKVLAKKYQCDPTQIALKYMLCKDAFPTIPIIGSGRLSEVKLSIEAMGIPLTKEECEYLENDAKE